MKHLHLALSLAALILVSGCGVFVPSDSTTPRRPGSRPGSPTSAIRTDIVTHAQELLGTRYKYGGNSPREGFDCSGFVRYLYGNAGLNIERVSRDQAKQGKPIPHRDARPGDLVFYRRGGQPVFHVSVVVAAGPQELWVIHSTSSRGVVRENVLASSYWKPKVYQVRDVIR